MLDAVVAKKLEEFADKMVDQTLSAKLAFWSALLTVHTVLLTVAVAMLALQTPVPKSICVSIGFLAFIGLSGILLNFAMIRVHLETVGRHASALDDWSEAKLSKISSQARVRLFISNAMETLSALLLLTQTMLLVRIFFVL